MFEHILRKTWIAFWLALATAAPASAEGPRAGFKLNAEATFTSPDQTIRVEQYFRDRDDSLLYQFWTFDRHHGHAFLLNPREVGDDQTSYAAGFRFSPDSQWLVRMQKLGAGWQMLFLYRRKGYEFAPATTKPLGDLAWDYFFDSPTSKELHLVSKDRDSFDHMAVNLVRGMEENYAWLEQHWPDSRYIVISLSSDDQRKENPLPWIEDWWCVYDTKTGAFSVPRGFAEHNAKAFRYPESKSK